MPEGTFFRNSKHFYIDVILKDGTYHHFTPRVLDILLESQRVHKFKRSTGWATVGVDPVRRPQSGQDYDGPERRAQRP